MVSLHRESNLESRELTREGRRGPDTFVIGPYESTEGGKRTWSPAVLKREMLQNGEGQMGEVLTKTTKCSK